MKPLQWLAEHRGPGIGCGSQYWSRHIEIGARTHAEKISKVPNQMTLICILGINKFTPLRIGSRVHGSKHTQKPLTAEQQLGRESQAMLRQARELALRHSQTINKLLYSCNIGIGKEGQ